MLEDFYKKALQGSAFTVFREVLMGHIRITELYKKVDTSAKDRVEDMKSKNLVKNK